MCANAIIWRKIMNFDEFDETMRIFETVHDVCVLPGIHMVARIDGRNFSRLTKETCAFKAPFDERFRDCLAETVRHLMSCGFSVIYGYTESDEISLLFDLDEQAFGRKHRKYNSILAAEAAAKCSLLLGVHAAFDCRICELPTRRQVLDYFRWRAGDALRNALNAHCYWKLREDGLSPRAAADRLTHMDTAGKNELLFQHGVNFNDLPAWQKRGMGFYRIKEEKEGYNPLSGESVITLRSRIHTEMELPINDAYEELLIRLMDNAEAK